MGYCKTTRKKQGKLLHIGLCSDFFSNMTTKAQVTKTNIDKSEIASNQKKKKNG